MVQSSDAYGLVLASITNGRNESSMTRSTPSSNQRPLGRRTSDAAIARIICERMQRER